MPPTKGMRRKMAKRSKTPDAPRKSIYEKMTGRKNPAWADKVYNSREFPSLYERITGNKQK